MSGMTTDIDLIDDNGIRIDGRKVDELRPLRIEAGVLKRADGSAYVEWGKNKVLAAVYGPRECHPRHMAFLSTGGYRKDRDDVPVLDRGRRPSEMHDVPSVHQNEKKVR